MRVGLHLMAFLSPSDDAIQYLPLYSSVNSISDTLGLDFVLIFIFTLPIKVPNASARQVIVAVNQYAHVPSRMVKHRRMPAPRNRADVLKMFRQRLLPFLGGIPGAVQAQKQLPNLSFLSFVVFLGDVDKGVALLLREDYARRTSLTVISRLSCGLAGSMVDACETILFNASSGGVDAYKECRPSSRCTPSQPAWTFSSRNPDPPCLCRAA